MFMEREYGPVYIMRCNLGKRGWHFKNTHTHTTHVTNNVLVKLCVICALHFTYRSYHLIYDDDGDDRMKT